MVDGTPVPLEQRRPVFHPESLCIHQELRPARIYLVLQAINALTLKAVSVLTL